MQADGTVDGCGKQNAARVLGAQVGIYRQIFLKNAVRLHDKGEVSALAEVIDAHAGVLQNG